MKMLNDIRGKFSYHVLLYTIALLMAFVIALFLFYQISFTGEIDRTVCHESVIFKGSIPDTAFVDTKEFVPLKCKTEKDCVTENKFFDGECESLGSEQSNVKIADFDNSGDNRDQENQIRKFVADEMVECWSTMGEGNIQIYGREFSLLETSKTACVTCSRIAFDEKVQEEISQVEDVTRYMIERNIPDSDKTYWEFLTGSEFSGKSLLAFGEAFSEVDRLDTSKEKAIVYIETNPTTGLGWVGAVGGGAAGAGIGFAIGSAVPFVGNVAGAAIGFVAGTVGAIGGGVAGYEGGDAIGKAIGEGSRSLVLVNTEDIGKLGCQIEGSIP